MIHFRAYTLSDKRQFEKKEDARKCAAGSGGGQNSMISSRLQFNVKDKYSLLLSSSLN